LPAHALLSAGAGDCAAAAVRCGVERRAHTSAVALAAGTDALPIRADGSRYSAGVCAAAAVRCGVERRAHTSAVALAAGAALTIAAGFPGNAAPADAASARLATVQADARSDALDGFTCLVWLARVPARAAVLVIGGCVRAVRPVTALFSERIEMAASIIRLARLAARAPTYQIVVISSRITLPTWIIGVGRGRFALRRFGVIARAGR
jgi:hypothetical protein